MTYMAVVRESSPMKLPNGEPWTSAEISTLRALSYTGAMTVADALGRSVLSVKMQAHRQGISLRTPGQRGGRILGLSNAAGQVAAAAGQTEHLRRLREQVQTGEVDASVIAYYEVWISHGKPLCPKCSRNPAEVESTGWCRPCHLRLALDGWRYALEIKQAQRENDAHRQRKHRANVTPAPP